MAIIHNITKKKATTDVTLYVYCQNSSTGAALTTLEDDTTDLVCYYERIEADAVAISLTNIAGDVITGAHTDGGFKAVNTSNMPGVYRLDLPDTVCATGSDGAEDVAVILKGAANLEDTIVNIQLVDNTAADIVTLIGTPADTDVSTDVAAISTLIGTPADTDVSTDVAAISTLIGTPADTDIATDIATVDANVDSILTDTSSTGVATTTAIGIKKDTALANFMFVMRSSTTHDPVAGKSVTGEVSIDGEALAALTNSVTGISNGIYKVSLHADDTDGDTLLFRFSATGCDDTLIFARTQS